MYRVFFNSGYSPLYHLSRAHILTPGDPLDLIPDLGFNPGGAMHTPALTHALSVEPHRVTIFEFFPAGVRFSRPPAPFFCHPLSLFYECK